MDTQNLSQAMMITTIIWKNKAKQYMGENRVSNYQRTMSNWYYAGSLPRSFYIIHDNKIQI